MANHFDLKCRAYNDSKIQPGGELQIHDVRIQRESSEILNVVIDGDDGVFI